MTAREKLKLRLNELNHTVKKSLGQNFLVADHVIEKIITQAQLVSSGGLVEVGPGLGALTDTLKKIDPQLQVIEFDHGLADYWRGQNLEVIEDDALRIDWTKITKKSLISNLPYQIAASLVVELSVTETQLENMVLMFQKEVAQRIKSEGDDDHYGFLSVMAQQFWDVQKLCDAGPQDFSPPPKIASRVLTFKRKSNPAIVDRMDFLKFVKNMFQNRRRQIRSILKTFMTEEQVSASMNYFEQNKKLPTLRTEELKPKEIQEFYLFFKSLKSGVKA